MDSKKPNGALGAVVDLKAFRQKKEMADTMASGRTPLFVSLLSGKVHGSPHLDTAPGDDYASRLSRIKASLERINQLMGELRKNSKDVN